MMWRSLEPHISAHANWQVRDLYFLHESSQGAGGEEAGGKVTQVWGWAGRQGWGGGWRPWDERPRRLPSGEVWAA